MKTRLRFALLALISAIVLPLMRAEPAGLPEKAPPGKEAPGPKFEHRKFMRHPDEKLEHETVAFLGVETIPVSPALTAQLGLPKEAGLVVRQVIPDSPAASVLQLHDVLLKIDDQLLIDSRQFSVLVRNHNHGDEVTLTYMRAGKQATTKVKLTTHEVPKRPFFGAVGMGGDAGAIGFFTDDEDVRSAAPGEVNHMLSLLDRDEEGGRRHHTSFAGPGNVGFRVRSMDVANSDMVFNDDEGSLELTVKDGRKSLVAKNAKGEPLFSGPIDTPEQRKALPDGVRTRLEKIEGMEDFSFEAGDDFHRDVRIAAPGPDKISLPLPEGDAERPSAAF